MNTPDAVTALSALAHAMRLTIFRALVSAGPEGLAAGRLAEIAGAAPSAVSFHLKELSHAGLISARQSGRFVIYVANFAQMQSLLAFLSENCCGGKPCLPAATDLLSLSEPVSP